MFWTDDAIAATLRRIADGLGDREPASRSALLKLAHALDPGETPPPAPRPEERLFG